MRTVTKSPIPSVEIEQQTWRRTQQIRLRQQFKQRLANALEKEAGDGLVIALPDDVEFRGQSERKMEMPARQKLISLTHQPFFHLQVRASRARPVTTRIIEDLFDMPRRARLNMPAKSCRPAATNRMSGLMDEQRDPLSPQELLDATRKDFTQGNPAVRAFHALLRRKAALRSHTSPQKVVKSQDPGCGRKRGHQSYTDIEKFQKIIHDRPADRLARGESLPKMRQRETLRQN